MNQARMLILAAVLALGAAAGLGAGWLLWRPKPAPVETKAPEVHQQDGSLVLARQPEAKPEPKHELPAGSKLERQIQVKVLPTVPSILTGAPAIPGAGAVAPPEAPKPITVDLSLVRMPDLTRRVVASSQDGTVVGGLDIPVEPAKPEPKQLKWAAGLDYTVNSWGNIKSFVAERDLGPLRLGGHVGVETITPPGGGMLRGPALGLSAMIRW